MNEGADPPKRADPAERPDRAGQAAEERGIVLIGDVVRSRRGPAAAGVWLRRLTRELDDAYGSQAIAPFAFTQGDELQGLLVPGADPLRAVLIAALDEERQRMRWAVAAGTIAPGEGRATERTGEAFYAARELIEATAKTRDGLTMRSGDARADALLNDLAPLLAELLDDLTARQREVARLALVEHLRQADVADRLDVSRASVSVTWGRGRVRSIERLARALGSIFGDGAAAGAGS
jgi:DNA-directed RNA polymerase specialized sigma24 family protein